MSTDGSLSPWRNTAMLLTPLLRSAAQTLPCGFIQGLMNLWLVYYPSRAATFIPHFLNSNILLSLTFPMSHRLGGGRFHPQCCQITVAQVSNKLIPDLCECKHSVVSSGWNGGIDAQSLRHSSASSAGWIRIWSSIFASRPRQLRVANVGTC